MDRLGRVVLERLMRYYRFLSEWSVRKSVHTVTSAEIAQALDLDATQIRKDFAAIGLMGMGHVGFDVCEVCRAIRLVLGLDQRYEAVLIGAGHLGGALLAYPGFAKYGLHFVAAFDNDQERIGCRIAGCTIKPIKALKPFIKRQKVRLAVLTTPAAVSQGLANCLVSAGIKAIWNFTPAPLTVPPDVLVRSEHISVGFSEIAYHLKQDSPHVPPLTAPITAGDSGVGASPRFSPLGRGQCPPVSTRIPERRPPEHQAGSRRTGERR